MLSALGLPAEALTLHGVEYYGGIGFLKAGLKLADRITTVSPTYARETFGRPEDSARIANYRVAVSDDGVVEQACEQGRPDFHAPVDVLGVGLEPGKIAAGDLSASQRTRWG